MFEIKGKIEFDPVNLTKKHNKQASWKKTAMVKFYCDTCEYYAWFLKKRFNLKLNKPIRGTHITIINDMVDGEVYAQTRKIFHGKELTFKYDPTHIRANDKGHWWLKVYCNDVANIRNIMGLSPDPYFGLHLTIGLSKNSQLAHSNYIKNICKKFNI